MANHLLKQLRFTPFPITETENGIRNLNTHAEAITKNIPGLLSENDWMPRLYNQKWYELMPRLYNQKWYELMPRLYNQKWYELMPRLYNQKWYELMPRLYNQKWYELMPRLYNQKCVPCYVLHELIDFSARLRDTSLSEASKIWDFLLHLPPKRLT